MSEVELLEGEGGYFLYFGDKTLEVGRGHVGFERGFISPGFVDHQAVGVGEGTEKIIFHASVIMKRKRNELFCQCDCLPTVFFGFGDKAAV